MSVLSNKSEFSVLAEYCDIKLINNQKCTNICIPDIDECISSPCQNGGSCQGLTAAYKCNCDHGFTGLNCEIGRTCKLILTIRMETVFGDIAIKFSKTWQNR